MKNELRQLLKTIVREMGGGDVEVQVEYPVDVAHGDYSTNVAMTLAKGLKRNPLDIAREIVEKLKDQISKIKAKQRDHFTRQSGQIMSEKEVNLSVLQDIEKIEIAPPGFINITLSASKLSTSINSVLAKKDAYGLSITQSGKRIMVEFAHPNTHKAFHIGHLRNITTGESIIRLLESQGVKVIRVNYQGDVGMHIAKALYALLHIDEFKRGLQNYSASDLDLAVESREVSLGQFSTSSNNKIIERVNFLGKAYAAGSKAFEENEEAKTEMIDLNALIYAAAQRFAKECGIDPGSTEYLSLVKGDKGRLDEIYQLWKETRQWSLDYFDNIYQRVGSHFDRLYFESECLAGVDLSKEAVKKGILKKSDGAIIFDGKPYGLDTRVFVNSLGLPTYEGKEMALATIQFKEFGDLDKLIHVLGPEQVSFTQVTFKVEELLGIQKNQQYHLVYGWVKLKQGKMSSRLGNVVLGEWLIDEVKQEMFKVLSQTGTNYSEQERELIAEKAAVAAVKYSFLRVSTLSDMAFDLKESVSLQGDSGPYLQYTYARCRSVARKADESGQFAVSSEQLDYEYKINPEEREVMKLLMRFPEVVEQAARDYGPNIICGYLFSLASAYNTFYNKHSILEPRTDNPRLTTIQRLALTSAVAQVIKNGLYLLGIETLEKM